MLGATCFLSSSFNSAAISRRPPGGPGVSARPACHDRRLSVARWVTPYGREAHWFSANTAALPLLSSAEAVAGAGVWLGMGRFSEKNSGNVHYSVLNIKTLFGWGMLSMGVNYTVILFIFIGDYHIPIGKSYQLYRRIQGGKL